MRAQAYQAIAVKVARNMNLISVGQPHSFYRLSQRLQWKSQMDGFLLLKKMSLSA